MLAFTIAAEIGEITRFPSAKKLVGYTGLCPIVRQSGDSDRRGPISKQGPKYLRWALLEATLHAVRHEAYRERYQATKKRLGRQRGAKVAQIDIARKLAEASGTCSLRAALQPLRKLWEAPQAFWPPDGPRLNCAPAGPPMSHRHPRRGRDREMSAAATLACQNARQSSNERP